MKQYVLLLIAVSAFSGCQAINYKEFYSQVAPSKYPATEKLMVFEYSNVDLDDIYEILFSDFLVIGKSGFIGKYESPDKSISYAKSIGADIFIATSQFSETRTSFMNLTLPTINTTYLSGYSGGGSFYGTATTYGTQTMTIPISFDRYAQHGMYLKNLNAINPLWERTKEQYQATGDNELSGVWQNESYQIEIFKSGDQMVGFINKILGGDMSWSQGQLKLIFGYDSGAGIYLMGDKTPLLYHFSLNKFGHLEAKNASNSAVFSFAKIR